MSTTEHLPPTGRAWKQPWHVDLAAISLAIVARGGSWLRTAAGQYRTNRALCMATACGIAAWLVLEFLFVAWVHFACEGDSHRAFLPGTKFGLPDREVAAGMQPVCSIGYDGQQYYLQSNDIFVRRETYKHLDNPIYRYQRIGIPMLAGGLATALGYELTPPLLYHSVQFGLTAIAFGALVYWLMVHQVNPAFALGWLIAGGTLQSLWLGILDAPTDAFFLFAILAALAGRLWWYVPLATLLVLSREGYVVYAFAVFVVSGIGWLKWRDVQSYWGRVALTALPGIAMISWTAYLSVRLHVLPLHVTGSWAATSWPFYMMARYLRVFYDTGNWFEFRLAVLSACTLVLVSLLLVRNIRRLPLAIVCAIPYVLLVASLGQMVWETQYGHMKANGTILLLGLMMMPIDKSMLLKLMLSAQALVGIGIGYNWQFMHPRLLSPCLVHEEGGGERNPPGSPDNETLSDLRNALVWVDAPATCRRQYRGFWDWCHREVKPVAVAVTNHSDVTWQPGVGQCPIWLGYTLYDDTGQKQICQHSVVLDKPIGPGETKEVTTYLELRRPDRKYQVEFSLWQDGPGWFVKKDPNLGRRYEFSVE